MHSVSRSAEPSFLAEFRASHSEWSNLCAPQRQSIRRELALDFQGLCSYCEQPCVALTPGHPPEEESIDHYKPRQRFPTLWLDWLNLVFSCRRCNLAKANKWPEAGDGVNQKLADADSRYTPITEYVNPNVIPSYLPATEFFEFDIGTGEILPSVSAGSLVWSTAQRTITDIDLNDRALGEYDPHHLRVRRRRQLQRLIRQLDQLDSVEEKASLALEFTKPDKPFSSYVRAWIQRLSG